MNKQSRRGGANTGLMIGIVLALGFMLLLCGGGALLLTFRYWAGQEFAAEAQERAVMARELAEKVRQEARMAEDQARMAEEQARVARTQAEQQALSQQVQGEVPAQAVLRVAKLLQEQGSDAAAQTALKHLLEQYPKTNAAKQARELLNHLPGR